MRSINKVIIIGNLTRDPEMRQTPNGQSVTTFGVATNREWVTREGSKNSSAEFHECVAWAKLAEICNQYLKKGQLVYVEGYLKTRSWDSPEGIKKFKTEIVVKDMIRLEKRSRDGQDDDYVPADSGSESFGSSFGGNSNSGDDSTGDDDDSDDSDESKTEEVAEETPAVEETSAEEAKETTEETPAAEAPAAEEPAKEEEKSEENPIDIDLGL